MECGCPYCCFATPKFRQQVAQSSAEDDPVNLGPLQLSLSKHQPMVALTGGRG